MVDGENPLFSQVLSIASQEHLGPIAAKQLDILWQKLQYFRPVVPKPPELALDWDKENVEPQPLPLTFGWDKLNQDNIGSPNPNPMNSDDDQNPAKRQKYI